jgi:hypothetical protein
MKERVSRAVGLGNLGSASRSCANVLGSPEPSRSSPMTTSHVRTRCCRRNAMSRVSDFRRCCIQAFVSTRITISSTPSAWALAREVPYRRASPVSRSLRAREELAALPLRALSSLRRDARRGPHPAGPYRYSWSYAPYASVQYIRTYGCGQHLLAAEASSTRRYCARTTLDFLDRNHLSFRDQLTLDYRDHAQRARAERPRLRSDVLG